jgi:hypothetical protein
MGAAGHDPGLSSEVYESMPETAARVIAPLRLIVDPLADPEVTDEHAALTAGFASEVAAHAGPAD